MPQRELLISVAVNATRGPIWVNLTPDAEVRNAQFLRHLGALAQELLRNTLDRGIARGLIWLRALQPPVQYYNTPGKQRARVQPCVGVGA